MNPETAYALLVDANPVPDPGTVPTTRLERVASPHPGSTPMLTLEQETHSPSTKEPNRRGWLVAAAAAVIAVVAIGVVALTRDDPEPVQPAVPVITADDDALPAPSTRESDAIATGAAFYRAAVAGDVDNVLAMSNPEFTDAAADRQMWEMIAVTTSVGEPWTIDDCSQIGSDSLSVEVGCDVHINDPVWEALDVADLVAPVRVFDDQSTQWRPFRGADFSAANRTYAEYLSAFHAAEYDAVCNPTAYELGTIILDGGLALTASCAELWVPLASDVAGWIDNGQPQP